ncbi:MAG: DUF7563 family protein [Halohasta sp.]
METFPMRQVVDEQDTQRTCNNCGSYVTKQFVRVFGANDGSVYGCMNCSTGRELREGGGTQP